MRIQCTLNSKIMPVKSWDVPSDSKYWKIAAYPFVLISIVAFCIIIASVILTTDSFLKAEYKKAGTVAAIGSGASTVLLVILTGWYASLTRELVSEAEKDREQQRELRRKDQTEEWYGDVLYHLRMIQNVWSRGFAPPDGVTEDGNVFVSLKSNQALWQELGSHFESIQRIVNRRPGHVEQEITETASDIHIQWVLMTDIDVGGVPEDPRVFQSDSLFKSVENLEDEILEVSDRH